MIEKNKRLNKQKKVREYQKKYHAKLYLDADYKEKMRARQKAWREANKEKMRARQKAWAEANKEKMRASCKKWYRNHREAAKAKSKAWAEANKEKIRAYKKAWRDANPEKVCDYRKKYYAKIRVEKTSRESKSHVKRIYLSTKQKRENKDVLE